MMSEHRKLRRMSSLSHMTEVKFVLKDQVFQVSALSLRQVCRKFPTNPLSSQYRVLSCLSTDNFKLFPSGLQGETIEVSKANFKEFSTLCHEFGFKSENSSHRLSQIETTIEELKTEIKSLFGEVITLRGDVCSYNTAFRSDRIIAF
jgi:hypothetical protein